MTQGLRLSQRLTQTLVLAPQLQQSLALLQAPMLELKALVERELQQNPVLEEVSPAEADSPEKLDVDDDKVAETTDPAEPPTDGSFDSTFEERSSGSGDDFQTEFERLAQIDQEWRDHMTQTNLAARPSAEDEEKRQFRFDSLVADPSLQEALLEQVRDTEIAEADYPVAEAIIGNIDDRGYLKASLEEIAQATGRSVEQVQPVLQIVQTFEPPGVAARDLRECLLLQLQRAEQTASLEYRIVRDHMEALSRRRIPELARATETSIEDVQSALARIAQLEPRPGREFSSEEAHYVLPEVFVQRLGDDFVVTTNNDQVPHLRISNTYKDLMSRSAVDPASLAAAFAEAPKALRTLANEAAEAMRQGKDIPALGHLRQLAEQRELTPDGRRAVQVAMAQLQEKAAFIEARDFIREKIRTGKFFIKSLHQRQQTIANIAHEIVARQREFLEKGVAHLKPLTMATVAAAVGVHETTVSRAVSGKYMQTPQGVFEMKYFFTSGIQTQDGTGLSNTSVKDMVAEIFKAESPTQPLSDREVVQMLKEKGIVIARRTVAKYRIELNILPSNLRKVY